MKRPLKGVRIARLPDVLLPLALLIPAILGKAQESLLLYACFLASHIASLGACCGLRAAFAWQTAIKSVRGSVKTALLLQIPGALVPALAALIFGRGSLPTLLPYLIGGIMLNIEHVFYEYLYAVGDGYSAALCHGLTALFTLAGVMLGAGGEPLPWIPAATALSALVGGVIAWTMGDGTEGKPNDQVLRCAPRALIYSLIYPVIFAGIAALLRLEVIAVPFFAGLAVYELCRSPYRRSPMESGPMNLVLASLCALCIIGIAIQSIAVGGPWQNPVTPTLGAIVLASACAFAAFGSVRVGRE